MKKRHFTAAYKAKIVLEILREEKTISEIGNREEIAVSQLHGWKKEFLENVERVFSQTKIEREAKANTRDIVDREQALMAKVGQLTVENDFLKKKSAQIIGYDWETKTGFKK